MKMFEVTTDVPLSLLLDDKSDILETIMDHSNGFISKHGDKDVIKTEIYRYGNYDKSKDSFTNKTELVMMTKKEYDLKLQKIAEYYEDNNSKDYDVIKSILEKDYDTELYPPFDNGSDLTDYTLISTLVGWSKSNYPDTPNKMGYMSSLDRLYKDRYNKDLANSVLEKLL